MSSISMEARLQEEVGILKSILNNDGTIGDQLVDLLEGTLDDLRVQLDDLAISGDMARTQIIFAYGFIHGVAEERDETILELLHEENLP